MIRPPWDGVAFSEADDGDLRGDLGARHRLSDLTRRRRRLGNGSPGSWSGRDRGRHTWRCRPCRRHVDRASEGCPSPCSPPIASGWSSVPPGAVGVAHSGWRGAAAGVVTALRESMADAGHEPERARHRPRHRPLLLRGRPGGDREVPTTSTETTWGTASVDLNQAVLSELPGIEVWVSGACTFHEPGWFSHRKDATGHRLATLGWLP